MAAAGVAKTSSACPPAAKAASDDPPDLWYLRTEYRKWLSLVVLCIGASFGQGPIMSFQILEPAMLDDGIFQCDLPMDPSNSTGHMLTSEARQATASYALATRSLNRMFTMGVGAATIPQLLIGLGFDAIGPRILAVTSFLIASVCFVLMGLALQFPCSFGYGQGLYLSIVVFSVSGAQVGHLPVSPSISHLLTPSHAIVVLCVSSRAPSRLRCTPTCGSYRSILSP